MNILELIKTYQNNYSLYEEFADKLEELFKKLLKTNKLNYLQIESRVKTLESFLEKAQRLNMRFTNPLEEIKDIIGIRIITHYREDIEKISKLIEKKFKIKTKNGQYDSNNLSPDKFGYLSKHYKVSISDELAKSSAWQQYKNIVFEIQLRTVVQHAWASIDHKLRYKTTREIPKSVKRQIFRLSALFEMADKEFSDIKRTIESNEKKYIKKYQSGNLNVELNIMSLESYLQNNQQTIKQLEYNAKKIGIKELNIDYDVKPTRHLLHLFEKSGVKTIKDLDDIIQEAKNKSEIIFSYLYKIIKNDYPVILFPSYSIILLFTLILRVKEEDIVEMNIDKELIDNIFEIKKKLSN